MTAKCQTEHAKKFEIKQESRNPSSSNTFCSDGSEVVIVPNGHNGSNNEWIIPTPPKKVRETTRSGTNCIIADVRVTETDARSNLSRGDPPPPSQSRSWKPPPKRRKKRNFPTSCIAQRRHFALFMVSTPIDSLLGKEAKCFLLKKRSILLSDKWEKP